MNWQMAGSHPARDPLLPEGGPALLVTPRVVDSTAGRCVSIHAASAVVIIA
jgi:hypothetical protein